MNTQTLIHRFFLIGGMVSLILIVLLAMFNQNPTNIPSKVESPTLDKNTEITHNLDGSFGDLEGKVLIRGDKITSEDRKGLVVNFTNSIDFSIKVWDQSVGKNDGDGIKSVQFKIFDENDIDKLVHERIEQAPSYCPFGGGDGGDLTCRISQLARKHKYRVEISPESKKPSHKRTLWSFHIQT